MVLNLRFKNIILGSETSGLNRRFKDYDRNKMYYFVSKFCLWQNLYKGKFIF
jgi:hypothetical protein